MYQQTGGTDGQKIHLIPVRSKFFTGKEIYDMANNSLRLCEALRSSSLFGEYYREDRTISDSYVIDMKNVIIKIHGWILKSGVLFIKVSFTDPVIDSLYKEGTLVGKVRGVIDRHRNLAEVITFDIRFKKLYPYEEPLK